MTRIRKISLLLVVGILLAYLIIDNYSYYSLRAPMVAIPLFITRNGAALLTTEIRSVRYVIDRKPAQSAAQMHDTELREAIALCEDCYYLTAPFTHSRCGRFFAYTTVTPEYHSVFLRIVFADGKVVALSCPVISDSHQRPQIHVDLSEGQH